MVLKNVVRGVTFITSEVRMIEQHQGWGLGAVGMISIGGTIVVFMNVIGSATRVAGGRPHASRGLEGVGVVCMIVIDGVFLVPWASLKVVSLILMSVAL